MTPLPDSSGHPSALRRERAVAAPIERDERASRICGGLHLRLAAGARSR